MKPVTKRRLTKITMLASLLSAAGWSANSHACATDPFVSSVCAMAFTTGLGQAGGFNGTYLLANGQLMSVGANQALYSLIGSTYGGNSSQFNLPDLQGRVLVGAGTYTGVYGPINYTVGQKGGAPAAALGVSNLPQHTHALSTAASGVTVTSGLGNLAVNVSLSSLSATTSLAPVTATAAGSGLTLNASSGGTTTVTPNGASLATTAGTLRIYSDAAPTIGMKANSITGTAPVTFTGNPSTTITGTASATLTGAPSVSVGLNGQTGVNSSGAGSAFSIMPPYLAMRYFIAVQGTYPSPD